VGEDGLERGVGHGAIIKQRFASGVKNLLNLHSSVLLIPTKAGEDNESLNKLFLFQGETSLVCVSYH
jgi:hypothetical protein